MLSQSSIRTICVVALYWTVSWSAIFLNKYVYSHMNISFSIPYSITFLQFASPTVALYIFSSLNFCNNWFPSFPYLKLSYRAMKAIFPLSVLFCITVTMSNLCLKYVEVSFYQISRSLGIPMIPLINFLLFGEKTTWQTVCACFTIVLGYIVGVEGEINFSLKGTLFGMGASLIGAFYTIYLKQYLNDVVESSWVITFYNNLNSCIILPFFCLLTGEIPLIWNNRYIISPTIFVWTFLAGIIGLLVGVTTQLQIKDTSSLSHNISGVMKNCIQTFMGAAIYKTYMTKKSICGVMLVVGGSISYTFERLRINNKSEPQNNNETKKLLEDDPLIVQSAQPAV